MCEAGWPSDITSDFLFVQKLALVEPVAFPREV